MLRDGRAGTSTPSSSATPPHLAPVSLPPLPGRGLGPPGGPGLAQRLGRAPTPPPRPESSLSAPPPPSSVASPPSSGPGRGVSATTISSDNNIIRDLPASLSSLSATPLATPITLNAPRAAQSRTQNLYVDTPFKAPGPPPQPGRSGGLKASHRHRPITVAPVGHHAPASVITSPSQLSSSGHSPPDPNKHPDIKTSEPGLSSPGSESIICVVCGRCRCVACGTPSSLPSRWLCDNSCLCSAESAVDTLSCMCCVKAAFYHCGERMTEDTDKEDSWVDSPCSCSSTKWWLRWGCLALLSLPLPCLLCYPLLKGINLGMETCYQAATARGCRCPDNSNNTTAVREESQQQSPNSSLSSPSDSHKRLLG